MPQTEFLIRPASSNCNLNCVYCNDNTPANEGYMSLQTARTVVGRAFSFDEHAAFTFCGGEPLLAGLDFFKAFAGFVKEHTKKPSFTVETNGTLIDGEWADFFKQHNFTVRLALDGYKETHNLNRFGKAGGGSFYGAVLAAAALKEHGVPFEVACVVNGLTVLNAKKIYAFYKSHGFNNITFVPCNDGGRTRHYSINAATYSAFLKELFDCWYKDLTAGRGISIKQFDNYVAMMYGYPADLCRQNGICPQKFAVEADGSVYPCLKLISHRPTDAHAHANEWLMGNANQTDFQALSQSPAAQNHLSRSAKISPTCGKCPNFKLCRGGCPLDRKNNTHLHCEAHKTFFNHSRNRLLKIAKALSADRII